MSVIGRALLLAVSFGLVACSGAGAPATDAISSGDGPPPGASATPSTPSTPNTPDPGTPSPEGGASACAAPTAKVGFAVGDAIGNLGVKDCDTGDEITIDEVCGAAATWIFSAHTHCPTCQATASFTDEVASAVASKNVAIVHVVYDDNGTSCAEWRAAYKLAGISNVRVYADPGGAVFAKLKTSGSTAPSAFLDRNQTITYKAHGLSKTEVLAQIETALAAP